MWYWITKRDEELEQVDEERGRESNGASCLFKLFRVIPSYPRLYSSLLHKPLNIPCIPAPPFMLSFYSVSCPCAPISANFFYTSTGHQRTPQLDLSYFGRRPLACAFSRIHTSCLKSNGKRKEIQPRRNNNAEDCRGWNSLCLKNGGKTWVRNCKPHLNTSIEITYSLQ